MAAHTRNPSGRGTEAKGLLRIRIFLLIALTDLGLRGHGYATAHVWRSEVNLLELVLSFHSVVTELRVSRLLQIQASTGYTVSSRQCD